MIKAVIFDYGGILTLQGTFNEFYPQYAHKHGCDPEELRAVFGEYWRKARVGEIDSWVLWQKIAEFVRQPAASVRKEWITWFGVRKGIYPLLAQLKKRYTLALLSNQIKDWMDEARKQQHLDDYFKVIIFSYEVKLIKPDPKIFVLLLQRLKLKPEECLFIDDQEKNTLAAAKMGFKTILFSAEEQLKQELTNYGVFKNDS